MAFTANDVLPEQRLRESYVKHAVRAQLHRLYAAIEEGIPAPDIFDDPKSAASMIAAVPNDALPAVEECRIDLRPGGRIAFATADGAFAGAFVRGDAFLPRLTQLAATSRPASLSASAGHRTRSSVHHFIALVENPARDPQPFRELLRPVFSLGYTPTPMTGLAALDAWVKGALSSVIASEHDIHAIDVRDLGDARTACEVRMTSQALFPDGSGAISRNTQSWTLHDAAGDRFPRIEEILIARDAVEFFGPAPLHEPRARP
jgi:hypothetical protein